MTTSEARNGLKSRLDIASSIITFDDVIDQFVLDAVKLLAPAVFQEVAEQQTTTSPSEHGQVTIDLSTLSTPLDDVREIEASTGTGDEWPVDAYSVHGTSLRIRELPSDTTKIHIYGLKAYTLTTLPTNLEYVVYCFAQALFYTFLMANKAKYNVYMQNGRGAVDNMQDLIDYFEQKGQDYLDTKVTPYGR